jgi:mRNA interferase MazF
MPRPSRGEVWMVDLGLAAKVRPCLLLTDWPADDELALITVLAHTSSVQGNPWEQAVPKSFLKEGAFHLQQINSVPAVKLERKLGELTPGEMASIEMRLRARLKL